MAQHGAARIGQDEFFAAHARGSKATLRVVVRALHVCSSV
jgi:hypothetical protein